MSDASGLCTKTRHGQDRVTNSLVFRCRTCHNIEDTTNYCVFRNSLTTNAGETAGVTTDIGSDPTVS